MFRLVVFAFLLTWTSVFGEKCVSNNFESDFDDLFKIDEFICFNGQPWQLANYSSIDIADVPQGSNRFIEPRTTLTCESTTSFHMKEGILEVNVYMKVESDDDYLSVFVSELTSDGHRNRGHVSFSRRIPDYKDGWNILRIDLTKSFNGFISFMGKKSEDSILLIDSFRYFAKDHEDDCGLYEVEDIDNDITTKGDIVESTTESPTKPDPDVEVTPESDITPNPVPEVEATTYPSAEEDINTTPKLDIETTAYPTPEEDLNTTPGLEIETTAYPTPEEDLNTTPGLEIDTTAFPTPEEDLNTTPGLEIDTTAYPTPEEDLNTPPGLEIETTAYPTPEEDLNTTPGLEIETTAYPTPEEDLNTTPGLEIDTTAYPTPEEDLNTTPELEIDTTAYPTPEEDLNTTPGLETDTTAYPIPEENVNTTPESAIETTANPIPEEEQTTYPAPEIQPTEPESGYQSTTNPPVDTEKCVTYNFENDFDKLFTHDHELCGGFNTWELNNYTTSNGIDTINAKGNTYLVPHEDLSCISSFPIRMSPNGLVEVNVYIEPASDLDYIIVLVKNKVQGSVDTVAGSIIYEPGVPSFVKGWNILRVNVVHLRSFDGFLILLGAASEGSTVLVDSFRYIPPWANANDEECQIP